MHTTLASTFSTAARLLTAAVLGTLLLTACGGGNDDQLAQDPQHQHLPASVAVTPFAKTGDTVRDFALLADGVEVAPEAMLDIAQTLRVLPSAAGASVSVVHWGDGE